VNRRHKANSGFVSGAYTAMMLVMVAVLATLVTTSAQTAKKIGTTQNYLATQQKMERLSRKIIAAATLDTTHNVLKMPNITGTGAGASTQIIGINDSGTGGSDMLDSNGNPFYYCSMTTISPNFLAGGDTPVFTIIYAGNDGIINTTCDHALAADPDQRQPRGDDRFRVITYTEAVNFQDTKKLALLDGVNSLAKDSKCASGANTLTINAQKDKDADTYTWSCRDILMPFATLDLPQCSTQQRLFFKADNTLECKDVERLADLKPYDLQTSDMFGSVCGSYGELKSFNYVSNHAFNFTCSVINADLAAAVSITGRQYSVNVPTSAVDRTGSCAANHAISYYSKDGLIKCVATSAQINGATGIGRCADATASLFVDNKGKAVCLPISIDSVALINYNITASNTCDPGQTPLYNNGQLTCGAPETYANLLIPQAQCAVGSYVVSQNGIINCIKPDDIIAMMTPAQSCTANQFASWDRTNLKFVCVARPLSPQNGGGGSTWPTTYFGVQVNDSAMVDQVVEESGYHSDPSGIPHNDSGQALTLQALLNILSTHGFIFDSTNNVWMH
jgi:hypothetical protein